MKKNILLRKNDMIIVKCIGGIGNQMFQYAFYRSLKNNYKNVKIDTLDFNNYALHNGFELDKVFNLNIDKANVNEVATVKDIRSNTIISRIIRKIFGRKKLMY